MDKTIRLRPLMRVVEDASRPQFQGFGAVQEYGGTQSLATWAKCEREIKSNADTG
jgi:hypothetical protein